MRGAALALVSGEQQDDAALHLCVGLLLPETLFETLVPEPSGEDMITWRFGTDSRSREV